MRIKKLLSILVLSLFTANASYSEIVNLNCKYLSGNISKFYVGLDFEKSLFINQHDLTWDMIYTDNIVQTAFFGDGGTHSHYLMTISRLSGSGSIKAFKLSEEELDKLSEKNIDDILLKGVGNLKDKSLEVEREKVITLNLINYLNKYKKTMYGHDIPPVNTEFECEKSEKKF